MNVSLSSEKNIQRPNSKDSDAARPMNGIQGTHDVFRRNEGRATLANLSSMAAKELRAKSFGALSPDSAVQNK
jgi:hypothetical protein